MFSGWRIAAALCTVYFLAVGVGFYGFAAIIPAMIADMGWSRGDASVGYALLSVMIGVSAPLAAIFVKHFGARNTLIVGGVLSGAGAMTVYYTNSLLQYYIGVGLVMGFGLTFQTFVPGAQILANWFLRRRSLVMGMFLSMSGLGAFVTAPGLAFLTEQTGDWRNAWLVIGAAALLGSVIAWLFVRNHPSDAGQHQDGVDQNAPVSQTDQQAKPQSRVHHTTLEWTARQALGAPAFWIIMFTSILATMGLALNTSQSVVYLHQDQGIDPVIAASALGTVGLMNAIGRFSGGVLGDYFDPRLIMAGGLAAELIGIVLLNFTDSVTMIYVYAVIFGIGYGHAYVTLPAIIANYFGPHDYAKILGYSHLIVVPFGAVASAAGGYAYDILHSYTMIFFGFSAIATVPVGLMLMLRPPARG